MDEWIDRFPGLSALQPDVRDRLTRASRRVQIQAGTVIFGPGHPPDALLLLLDGRVRVQQTTEGGRHIVLYRVHSGESCVMTTACLLAYEDYTAEGIAETDIEAVAIPRAVFDDGMATSPAFRRFVFSAYSKRITDLFLTIEEIAFGRMDARLAAKLLELSDNTGSSVLKATHGSLATELGTARESVSRQMAEFARRGWVEQRRGAIQLVDAPALRKFAETNPV
ncbi:Crp/Fnr family transcriptional regulator [Jannaschia pagri]|uniref:Crp/Fnr family transcriptional regulator n=1 Tax=Jannaschia pagri TaxID=2829797 RepID=A0ABQ4NN66_9RHOB|nr:MULTISPECIES: Crp/Fnr family transcriptional regulator [unclassified Jannaschia]GIT91990.1 Crp/Fnr family transcriptional regulator [Jannaschia sp. AI_61]GIT95824.1 Crp/Fnr family transcriptional regulator [Jannaschia sp. AI_62]